MSSPTNVVRLPRASARKVKQAPLAVQRAYRQANPWPAVRAAAEYLEDFPTAARTPELAIALSLYKILPEEQKWAALAAIAPIAAADGPSGAGADAFHMMLAMTRTDKREAGD